MSYLKIYILGELLFISECRCVATNVKFKTRRKPLRISQGEKCSQGHHWHEFNRHTFQFLLSRATNGFLSSSYSSSSFAFSSIVFLYSCSSASSPTPPYFLYSPLFDVGFLFSTLWSALHTRLRSPTVLVSRLQITFVNLFIFTIDL